MLSNITSMKNKLTINLPMQSYFYRNMKTREGIFIRDRNSEINDEAVVVRGFSAVKTEDFKFHGFTTLSSTLRRFPRGNLNDYALSRKGGRGKGELCSRPKGVFLISD